MSYGNYEAVEKVLSYDMTGCFIFLFAFLLIRSLLQEEKPGLKKIYFITPGGRGRQAVRQLLVCALYVTVFAILSFLMLLAVSVGIYGKTGSLGNSAQSMIMLEKCTLPVSVGEYLLLYVAVNVLLALAAALFAWLWMELFRTRLLGILAVLLIGGIEAVFYFRLSDTSGVVCLKYINVFRFIRPGDILYEYRNFNLGGTPVNCLTAILVLAVGVIVLSAGGIILIREKRRPIAQAGRVERMLAAFFHRMEEGCHRGLCKLSLGGYELYKMLLVNKGLIFVLLWLFLLLARLDLAQVNFIGTRAYLNEIYREYEGVDDDRLRAWMAEKQAELEQVTQEYETKVAEYAAGSISDAEFDSAAQRYSSYSTVIAAVGQLEEQLAYVDRLKEKRDIDVWIVNERPYRLLWTENGLWVGSGYEEQEFIAIANLLLIIFLMSSVFSYDKSCGMYGVIRCTKGGRISLFRKKTGISALVCVLVSGVSYGLRLWEVCRNDPLHCLNAPVQSLRFLEDFPLSVSIGGFLCIVFCSMWGC